MVQTDEIEKVLSRHRRGNEKWAQIQAEIDDLEARDYVVLNEYTRPDADWDY